MPSCITGSHLHRNESTRYTVCMGRFRRGNGAAWLDLLSTLAGRYREEQVDAIDTTESLRAWLREFDLEPAGAVTASDVAHAAQTREALHRLAVAAVRRDRPAAADVRRLNAALARDEGLQVSSGDMGVRPRRPGSVDDAFAGWPGRRSSTSPGGVPERSARAATTPARASSSTTPAGAAGAPTSAAATAPGCGPTASARASAGTTILQFRARMLGLGDVPEPVLAVQRADGRSGLAECGAASRKFVCHEPSTAMCAEEGRSRPGFPGQAAASSCSGRRGDTSSRSRRSRGHLGGRGGVRGAHDQRKG